MEPWSSPTLPIGPSPVHPRSFSNPGWPARPVRVGDAERDRLCELLNTHYSGGRLSAEELQQRTSLALSAQYDYQLAGLVADLPREGWTPTLRPQAPWAVTRVMLEVFAGLTAIAAIVCFGMLVVGLVVSVHDATVVAALLSLIAGLAIGGVGTRFLHLMRESGGQGRGPA